MEEIGIIGLVIMVAIGVVSYKGFTSSGFFNKYSFKVDKILVQKEYRRLVTSGFLHLSWTHLIFNIITFYYFSEGLEVALGPTKFIIIYFGSLIGGNFFSLFIHKNHSNYSAVGASGAISGIVFASIALFPGLEIGFPGIDYYIPGWSFGLLYVIISVYGIKLQRDNIGHEAHLGGGLVGLIIAVVMVPQVLVSNYVALLLILFPSSIFVYLIFTRPEFLLVGSSVKKEYAGLTFEDKYNAMKKNEEKELDNLLDKINMSGMSSLSKEEQEKLNKYANK